VVQASPSSHGPELLVVTQPLIESQASSVQGLPSSTHVTFATADARTVAVAAVRIPRGSRAGIAVVARGAGPEFV
jgi:hypothetical protein